MAGALAQPFHAVGGESNLVSGQTLVGLGLVVGALDGVHNLVDVERDFRTASLDDLHGEIS